MAVAIIEALIIATIFMSRTRIEIKQTETPLIPVKSPLQLALEYDASDEKFQELVKNYPEWIQYRPSNAVGPNWPILADCAILKKTNYVRILIANGADVEQSVRYLNEARAKDAVQLLKLVQSEVEVKERKAKP